MRLSMKLGSWLWGHLNGIRGLCNYYLAIDDAGRAKSQNKHPVHEAIIHFVKQLVEIDNLKSFLNCSLTNC